MVTKNFGLCFAAKEKFYRHFLATTKKIRSPVGVCQKKLISDPALQRKQKYQVYKCWHEKWIVTFASSTHYEHKIST